jgi:isochorismate pyruvate lyase
MGDTMKAPKDCQNIEEIRVGIDAIDYEIVRLLAQRSGYVQYAAKFKTSTASVKAEDRVKSMLNKRREWAAEHHVSPDIIEEIYRTIVNSFINNEMKEWKEKNA